MQCLHAETASSGAAPTAGLRARDKEKDAAKEAAKDEASSGIEGNVSDPGYLRGEEVMLELEVACKIGGDPHPREGRGSCQLQDVQEMKQARVETGR